MHEKAQDCTRARTQCRLDPKFFCVSRQNDTGCEECAVGANQAFDLTVNGQAKKFCNEKVTTLYSEEVQRQLDSGTSFELVEVDLRMSVIKPLYAGWLVALYDYLTGA